MTTEINIHAIISIGIVIAMFLALLILTARQDLSYIKKDQEKNYAKIFELQMNIYSLQAKIESLERERK